MELNVENFVKISTPVMLLLVVYMAYRRPKPGVRLRMQAAPKQEDPQAKAPIVSKDRPRSPDVREAKGEKSLNVIFNYNGHSWDAYEVLGLPAGSSLEKVEQAYRTASEGLMDDSKAFLTTAYQAIVKHHS